MEQMGERCEETKLWCKKTKEARDKKTEVQVQIWWKKLKEDHIFREFENIVHGVGRRLWEVRVRSWRTRLPYAFRIGIVPACPVHPGILERSKGRHGPEGV
jgi:hypothetical protein